VELIRDIAPYINQSAFARICKIDAGQMRQYASGVRNPSRQTLDKIVNNLYAFGDDLKNIRIE